MLFFAACSVMLYFIAFKELVFILFAKIAEEQRFFQTDLVLGVKTMISVPFIKPLSLSK